MGIWRWRLRAAMAGVFCCAGACAVLAGRPDEERWALRAPPESIDASVPAESPSETGPPTEEIAPSEPGAAGPLSLDALLDIALQNNPTLAVAAARVEVIEGKWVQVGLAPNPVMGYMADEIGRSGSAGQQGGFVQQKFVTGGKLGLRRAAADAEIAVARRRLALQRQRVVNDVSARYYDVLVAQRRAGLAARLVDISTKGATAAGELFRRGEVAETDWRLARIEAHRAAMRRIDADNQLIKRWKRLIAVMGTPEMPPRSLVDNLKNGVPDWTWNAALERVITASPELAAAGARIDQAGWELRRAKAEVIPNVTLQAAVQVDDATRETLIGVQAGVPIPLWNVNQGEVLSASAKLAEAHAELRRVELDLMQRLASEFAQYKTARQQVRGYVDEVLPDARWALDLIDKSYRAGEADYLRLLTAQQTYFQTNLDYLDAISALRQATVAIEGHLVSGGLRAAR